MRKVKPIRIKGNENAAFLLNRKFQIHQALKGKVPIPEIEAKFNIKFVKPI